MWRWSITNSSCSNQVSAQNRHSCVHPPIPSSLALTALFARMIQWHWHCRHRPRLIELMSHPKIELHETLLVLVVELPSPLIDMINHSVQRLSNKLMRFGLVNRYLREIYRWWPVLSMFLLSYAGGSSV